MKGSVKESRFQRENVNVDHLGIEITLKVTRGEKRNNCKMKPKERLLVSLLLWSLLILQTSGETRHKRGGESDR